MKLNCLALKRFWLSRWHVRCSGRISSMDLSTTEGMKTGR